MTNAAWSNDAIQFPRLLAEIMATQDGLDMGLLAESMDLTVDEVSELFDRADAAWEGVKAGKSTLSVDLNVCNRVGEVVGYATAQMTQAQISDVVSHAAQLVRILRSGRRSSSDMDAVLAELGEALDATSVLKVCPVEFPPDSRYLVADGWSHIFEGMGERIVRFVYDVESERISHLQIGANQGWRNATEAQRSDVEDSLKNANSEAFDAPDDYGLVASDRLPGWWSDPRATQAAISEGAKAVAEFIIQMEQEHGFRNDRDSILGAVEQAARMLSIDLDHEAEVAACDYVLGESPFCGAGKPKGRSPGM